MKKDMLFPDEMKTLKSNMSDTNPPQPPAATPASTSPARSESKPAAGIDLNPTLTGKHFLIMGGVGLAILIGWFSISQHKRAVQERARQEEQARQEAKEYFDAEETFTLTAKNGADTSFKDIETTFRNFCYQNNQRVAVKSIELAFNSLDLTHVADDRISGSDVADAIAHGEKITRSDMATINNYNRYARGPTTVSDGANIEFGVNVTITHRVKKAANTSTPLAVEWLTSDQSAASRLPMRQSDNKLTVSLTKYGIQLTYTNITYEGNYRLFEAKGILGENTFHVKILRSEDYLSLPSDPFIQFQHITTYLLFDSPIEYLRWNGKDVFSLSGVLSHRYNEAKDKVDLDGPVLNQPGIKTVATWARDIEYKK
jgi:hypothetical protein